MIAWEQFLTISRGQTQKKKKKKKHFGGPKLVFFAIFFKFGSLVFLDIAI